MLAAVVAAVALGGQAPPREEAVADLPAGRLVEVERKFGALLAEQGLAAENHGSPGWM